MPNVSKLPKTAFKPGCAPGPGRPIGARSKLTETALAALGADFAEHGVAVIEQVRRERPHHYLSLVVSLMPRQLTVERLSPFEHLTDAELDLIEETLRAGRARLVPQPEDAKQQDS
jgi:hypothetical protein